MTAMGLRLLVIYDNPVPIHETRLTILHHLRALEYSETPHEITYLNSRDARAAMAADGIPAALAGRDYDGAVLHYSFLSMRNLGLQFYRWKQSFEWIGSMSCPVIAIPQDEGSYAAVLDEWLCEMGVSSILSVHYSPEGPLYPIMRKEAEIIRCLPGYIDEASAADLSSFAGPICSRKTDIVYRARRLPYFCGSAGQLKSLVAEVVQKRAELHQLATDISTRDEDVIHGSDWLGFLASGRAVLGAEGGYSAIDWHGEVRAQMHHVLEGDPTLTFEDASTRMPSGWDDYGLLTITPRHFEAAMARTCQVLVEGEYGGILEAGKHYLPIERDFSNVDEVLEQLKDHQHIQRIADRCYEDICQRGKYTYREFARLIEGALERKPMEKAVRTVSNREQEALERQLIAERHYRLILQLEVFDALSDRLRDSLDKLPGKVGQFLWRQVWRLAKRILYLVIAASILAGGAFALYYFLK